MRICKVGGQAVMEGVMMKSEKGIAMAVRTNDGKIVTEYTECTSKAKKGTFLGLPIVRGVVAFIESLTNGMKMMTRSAELYGEEPEQYEPSKFEKFLSKLFGKSVEKVVVGLAVVLAIVMSVGLFFVLPLVIGNLIYGGSANRDIWRSLIEGGVRLLIFLGYILMCAGIKDIKRVFMYHGAEHKTIACYEAEDELTPQNAMKYKRLHPRCGTNYLFLVMAVSILFFTTIDFIIPLHLEGFLGFLFRLATRLVFLPLVAGISYEVLQAAAKSNNLLARIVRAPGMGLQLITTKEPTEEMIEVAIASFNLAMKDMGENVLSCSSCAETKCEAAPEKTAVK
ncbi:MAG: DUF1385 domain-containing protein [Clostridia bacterium]